MWRFFIKNGDLSFSVFSEDRMEIERFKLQEKYNLDI